MEGLPWGGNFVHYLLFVETANKYVAHIDLELAM
jgi:hypothetical protein